MPATQKTAPEPDRPAPDPASSNICSDQTRAEAAAFWKEVVDEVRRCTLHYLTNARAAMQKLQSQPGHSTHTREPLKTLEAALAGLSATARDRTPQAQRASGVLDGAMSAESFKGVVAAVESALQGIIYVRSRYPEFAQHFNCNRSHELIEKVRQITEETAVRP